MKYSVHSIQDKETGDFYHAVFEESTQQVIQFHYFLDDAEDQASFMESGGAFNGITPSFIIKEVMRKNDLNFEFSKITS